MEGLVLRPLHVGTIRRDKSLFTYLQNMGTTIDLPVLAWYIEGKGTRILVDTGGHDPAQTPLHAPYSRDAKQDPAARLAAFGVRPEDIDILILTHLHWDHASNVHLFPRARILVQREELRYAASPLPPHRVAYRIHPRLALDPQRCEVVDGDARVAEGVSVHLTPGHTPGIQGVAMRAPGAVYFVASDTISLGEMWDAKEKYGVPHWPGGIHVDLEAYCRTLRRIEDLGEVILPSHDWKTLERAEYR